MQAGLLLEDEVAHLEPAAIHPGRGGDGLARQTLEVLRGAGLRLVLKRLAGVLGLALLQREAAESPEDPSALFRLGGTVGAAGRIGLVETGRPPSSK